MNMILFHFSMYLLPTKPHFHWRTRSGRQRKLYVFKVYFYFLSVESVSNPENLWKKNLNEIQKYYFQKPCRCRSYPAATTVLFKRVRQQENDYPLYCQEELFQLCFINLLTRWDKKRSEIWYKDIPDSAGKRICNVQGGEASWLLSAVKKLSTDGSMPVLEKPQMHQNTSDWCVYKHTVISHTLIDSS